MTDEELTTLETLAAAATAGPWDVRTLALAWCEARKPEVKP